MTYRGWIYAGIVLLLVLSAYLVPYFLLSNIDAWYGSFLFWTLFAAAGILVNVAITKRWRD